MKFLIVDDNPQMREMIRQFLPAASSDVRECADGVNALSAYTEFLPDFVLMDWQMKLMDGLTATRQILQVHPQARIFLVSQYDDEQLRASAFESGIRDFVTKDNLARLRTIIKADSRYGAEEKGGSSHVSKCASS